MVMMVVITRAVARKADEWFGNTISIHFASEEGRRLYVAKPVVMETPDEGMIVPPCVRIDQTAAQELMDTLWQCGIRPTEGSGSAGALAAVQRHLEDFRALVFKTSPGK
jgi:hypothetical protein